MDPSAEDGSGKEHLLAGAGAVTAADEDLMAGAPVPGDIPGVSTYSQVRSCARLYANIGMGSLSKAEPGLRRNEPYCK